MVIDLEESSDDLNFSPDICIIGGGAAGQTLAARLARYKLSVLIVESGGKDFRKDIQSLAEGEISGEPYYPLDTARLRLYGGTAAIWGGRCAELDPIDFEKRDYVPYSGWPFPKSELNSYYEDVYESMSLNRSGEGRLWKVIGRTPPDFEANKLDSDLWAFDENVRRFTDLSQSALKDTDILLNATLTEITLNDQGAVSEISATTLSGTRARIKARIFVLASGAIETIRLLMAAAPVSYTHLTLPTKA